MSTLEEIIKKIEEDLQLNVNKSPMDLCYETNDDVITELSIDNRHFENLDLFSPVFKTLKKLKIWWGCTFDERSLVEHLKKFEALEELSVSTTSVKTANGILGLKRLKKLDLWIKLGTEVQAGDSCVLDVSALQNLHSLSISCRTAPEHPDSKFMIRGIRHLNQLEELGLEFNGPLEITELSELTQLRKLTLYEVDIQSIPKIECLKTLFYSHRFRDEFDCAGKFPNLEHLKIEGFSTIQLGELNKLRILVMGARDFDLEHATCFDHLPNLEQLSLTNCDITTVKKIGQLKNLKMLDLSENYELVNIDELEELKKLERLNLYDNKISDIRVLNYLPNLIQVDLACNAIGTEEVREQLDRPEIACFMGVPHVPFLIGGSEIF